MGGWVGGWVGGAKSRYKDCLRLSKIDMLLQLVKMSDSTKQNCNWNHFFSVVVKYKRTFRLKNYLNLK